MICLFQQTGLEFKEVVEEALRGVLGKSVILNEKFNVPYDAYNPLRSQYEAERIIENVFNKMPLQCNIGIVIVNVDIYAPKMNFIFGMAEPLKRIALVSTYRLDDREKLKERLGKEIVHEVGHLLGLGHCSNPVCVMYFSNTIYDTDRKANYFCDYCRRKLEEL
ncbi:MAG: archaemetzincin family Zn-dependent metalloprotease [candidate division WOR-3 bacterium]